LKDALRDIVSELDHKVLIPEKSGIDIEKKDKSINVTTLGKHYVFPQGDCALLPIQSTSVENLAKYILELVVKKISSQKQIKSIEIGVDEGFGQGARISKKL
jgi:6-pyruvoyltetrahydropterin/6-carboxytetrahydropterin synthase